MLNQYLISFIFVVVAKTFVFSFFSAHIKATMKLLVLAVLAAVASAFTGSPLKTAFKSSSSLQMAKFKPALKYVPAIPLKDLPKPGGATSAVAGGLAICIAVDQKGSVYALGDKCPPVNQPLSFGKVNADGTIQDPVLGTKFSLKSGEPVQWCPSGLGKLIGGAFSPVGVPTYPVRQRGGFLEVQVDVNAKFNFEADYWSGILDAQGKADGKYY